MIYMGHVSVLEVDLRDGPFLVKSKAVSRDWTKETQNRGSQYAPAGVQIWKI